MTTASTPGPSLLSVLGATVTTAGRPTQSATSHSLSFSRPLLVSEQEIPGHGTHLAVAGLADCTRLWQFVSAQTGRVARPVVRA